MNIRYTNIKFRYYTYIFDLYNLNIKIIIKKNNK